MHARRRTLQLLLTLAVLPVLVLVPLAFATMAAPRATFEGRYVLRHSDDFAAGKAVFQPALELANGDVKELVFSPGRKPSVNPGSSVRLRGELRGNRIVVADGSTQVTGSGSTTAAQRRRSASPSSSSPSPTRRPSPTHRPTLPASPSRTPTRLRPTTRSPPGASSR